MNITVQMYPCSEGTIGGGICLLYGLFDQAAGEQELVGLDVVAALLEIVMSMPAVSRLEDF